ncbi:MAG: transposase [Ferruginibacter sp.]
MSRKHKFWDSNKAYFISFATVSWLDIFTRNEYKDELIKSWQHCQQKKGLDIYASCIMPSHVHMIICSHDKLLEDIVRDMKSHTASALKKLIKEHPQESRREWIMWIACPGFLSGWKEQVERKATIQTGAESVREQQHNKPIEILNRAMFAEIVFYTPTRQVIQAGIKIL